MPWPDAPIATPEQQERTEHLIDLALRIWTELERHQGWRPEAIEGLATEIIDVVKER